VALPGAEDETAVTSRHVERTYVVLTLLQTLAASLIWGINTLFLLDAGLSLTETFVANAAFTAGMVIFEVPTGVVADAYGRRTSFLLGAATLMATTLLYLLLWRLRAGVGWWMLVSALIGLGFTFFSGATEAWLVDALTATGFRGKAETVFAKGQIASGAATLTGTIAGGFLGQIDLGLPYLVRSALLVVLVGVAAVAMHDLGYQPQRIGSMRARVGGILRQSIRHGVANPPVRLLMLAGAFSVGAGIWIFYAFQPYLLGLYGRGDATWLAGAAAAIFALAQIVGGASVKTVTRFFSTRTGILVAESAVGATAVIGVGLAQWLAVPVGFWLALVLLTVTALGWALAAPLEQAYLNAVIPAEQRATVLSFVSLTGSAGGVVLQPALGRIADVYSLGAGYVVAGGLCVLRLPFLVAARGLRLPADQVAEPAPPPPRAM